MVSVHCSNTEPHSHGLVLAVLPASLANQPIVADVNGGFLLRRLILLFLLGAVPALADPVPRFSGSAVWNQDIAAAALHPSSASMISTLDSLGGFGNGRLQIDFGETTLAD